MTFRELVERLKSWRRREVLQQELNDELRAHAELLARDLEREGLSPSEARAAANRQLGHVAFHRDEARDSWGFPAIDTLLQDLRYALRGLRRSPGFTITAVLTLALGIGGNAAMFAVIDRLMFRPLPYMKDPGSVGRAYLQQVREGKTTAWSTMPYTRAMELARNTHSFSQFAVISEWRLSIGTGPETRVGKVAGVSGSFFSMFDAQPVRGRFFGPADDVTPIGSLAVVLSNRFWLTHFGGDDVLDRPLRVGSLEYRIIGVAPPDFVGAVTGGPPDLFVPATTIPANLDPSSVGTYFLDYRWDWTDLLVRLKPGVTAAMASADLGDAYRRSRATQRISNPRVLPDSIAHPAGIFGAVRSAAGPDAGMESRVLFWVAGVALIVLLVACANVANLMLARILKRRREIALRLALGVSRGRLAAQFITEALALALLGGVAGLMVAQWGGVAIRALLLPEGSSFNLGTDWRTIVASLTCVTIAAVLTVLAPLALALRSDLAATLKSGAREGTYRSSWLRSGLLIMQGALSVVLLVGAGLFVRSLNNVRSIPLGYDVSTVLDVNPDFRGEEANSTTRQVNRERLLAAAQRIPGVVAAARVNSVPFSSTTATLKVAGIDSVEKLGRFSQQIATPDYFKVMRTRILRGRGFDSRDGEGTAPTIVVSASMARLLWPGKDPLDQRVQITWPGRAAPIDAAVIGIAEDIAQRGITDEQRLTYYLSVDQIEPDWVSTIFVRMAPGNLDADIERVRRALQAEMPGNGYVVVTPAQKYVDDQQRAWTLGATLFLAFGALALIVAAVGLYGVIGYNVAQRMHELGVRIALGASARDVLRLIVGEGVAFAVTGVAIGLAGALAGARWLQPLLYKESARDPMIYGGIAAMMIVVAMLASAAPGFRATRADPNRALRSE